MALYRLMRNVDKARFDFSLVTLLPGGDLLRDFQQLDIRTESLQMGRSIPRLSAMFRLRQIIRDLKPDIVQSWLYHADLVATLATIGWRQGELLWNVRCADMDLAHYSVTAKVVRRLLVWLSSRPIAVICNSVAGKRFHEQVLGYGVRRWELISNGFDTGTFRSDPGLRLKVRRELGLAEDAFVIGIVGREDPMKDHGNFLRAAALLIESVKNVRFVMAGRGVDVPDGKLSRICRQLRLDDRVCLLGERRDVPALMAAFDCFSLTSAFGEGFPNVIGEAMACGVPCVATDVGDAREIIGEYGLVVPPRDPVALADAWKKMIQMALDRRRALGTSARRRIEENYSLSAIVRQYEALYQELAEHVRHRRVC